MTGRPIYRGKPQGPRGRPGASTAESAASAQQAQQAAAVTIETRDEVQAIADNFLNGIIISAVKPGLPGDQRALSISEMRTAVATGKTLTMYGVQGDVIWSQPITAGPASTDEDIPDPDVVIAPGKRLHLDWGTTRFVLGPDASGDNDASGRAPTAFSIRNPSRTGPLSIVWPDGSGSTFVTGRPSAALTADAVIDSHVLVVDDTSDFAVGDIIETKQQRIDHRGETREFVCHGEDNVVVGIDGNTLILRYPHADSYNNEAVLWSGNPAGGTTEDIDLSTIPNLPTDAREMLGRRLRFSAGPNAGVVRYLTRFDPVTKIASIKAIDATYAQALFPQAPSAADTVLIDSPTYVFATTPVDVQMIGKPTFVAGGGVQRGMLIEGCRDFIFDDLVFDKFAVSGIQLVTCVGGRIGSVDTREANFGDLGYAVLASQCRDLEFGTIKAFNCRRGGVDCAGSFGSWDITIRNVVTIGGRANNLGQLWGQRTDPNNPNSAIVLNYGDGEHGQARRFVVHHMRCEHVAVPIVSRGYLCRYGNISTIGKVEMHVWALSSSDLHIDTYHYDGWGAAEPLSDAHGCLLRLSGTRQLRSGGGVRIRNVSGRGFRGDVVYGDVSEGQPITGRVAGALSISGLAGMHFISDNGRDIALFGGTASYCAPPNWDVEWWSGSSIELGTGRLKLRQPGTIVVDADVAGAPVYFRVGHQDRFSIRNGESIDVPTLSGATQISVRMWHEVAISTVRVDGIIRTDFVEGVGKIIYGADQNWTPLAADPTGAEASGPMYGRYDRRRIRFNNRTGATATMALVVER